MIDPLSPPAPAAIGESPQTPLAGEPLELLSFTLAGQDYAMDIMLVREIRNWSEPTPLPRTPDFVRGVINLRGTVLPILDLAKRLGLPGGENEERAVIIVLNVAGRSFGVTVDAVSDILTVPASALQDAPNMGEDAGESFVRGLLLDDERMIRILAAEDLAPRAHGAPPRDEMQATRETGPAAVEKELGQALG
ncbi:MAG: chemotaxis protein CheW [Pseudomonadota bacterium]